MRSEKRTQAVFMDCFVVYEWAVDDRMEMFIPPSQ